MNREGCKVQRAQSSIESQRTLVVASLPLRIGHSGGNWRGRASSVVQFTVDDDAPRDEARDRRVGQTGVGEDSP